MLEGLVGLSGSAVDSPGSKRSVVLVVDGVVDDVVDGVESGSVSETYAVVAGVE